MKKIILLAVCLLAISCAKKEETAAENPSSSNVLQACTFYVDNGTHSYFQCIDFSGNGASDAEVKSECDTQNSGTVSGSCGISYSGGTDSTGFCTAPVSGGDTVILRWYYSVIGDAPSETALCTANSGTFTAN